MARQGGAFWITQAAEENVRAFIPFPLPPADPPLRLDDASLAAFAGAMAALAKLALAAEMVPSADWFLYGFVRKEALITSQIEGTQATLQDVLAFEAGEATRNADDVREVCNYLEALNYARSELAKPRGLPLSIRLLCEVHKRLMKGVRGADKQPGEIRRSQNWIGGTRPGNAQFVPPPPHEVPALLSSLEKWIHSLDPIPPLVRAGLAHVQFETIHPFLDGNGRIGRLLITLLVEHWGLIKAPLLYLSVAFKRHRQEYYQRLAAVRSEGDWEGWTRFFLLCVTEAAEDGVQAAQRLYALTAKDRESLVASPAATIQAIRLLDLLPGNPILTLPRTTQLLKVSKPTAIKAIRILRQIGILRETSGKKRDRIWTYDAYLKVLARDTD